ncbi:MAG TPA: Zn-dependent hydrolase [Planctomycetaceae bacterium]|nr:Zn-dependent hydrolase [Planctomycetaceae bacterium]
MNDSPISIDVDADRLINELNHLATLSDCPEPPPAVTRVVFTETDLKARAYLRSLYEEAGLQVRVDPIGNTFARWIGRDDTLPAVATGSHTDAIPHAGMYDGTVGVLGGLEAIRSLMRCRFSPRRSIELVMFTSEEPTRFAIGCTGSRAMAGAMSVDRLSQLMDASGDSYDAVRQRSGFTGSIYDAILAPGHYASFVELHIEQGPELEADGIDIGVVTAIAAPATYAFQVDGQGGHAGAVLMPRRKDALCAAAEMVTAIESAAHGSNRCDLVATVGELTVHPGAVNSIPSRVRFTMDIRDIDAANRNGVIDNLLETIDTIARRRGVTVEVDCHNCDPPATCDNAVIACITQACQTSGVSHQRMISRAYHDSLFMARISPVAMIFIPCRGGVSHRPDEYSSPDQITKGVEVLARSLAELSLL